MTNCAYPRYIYQFLFFAVIASLFGITWTRIFSSDDLWYSLIWGTSVKVTGLSDAIHSQIGHYADWCGRFVVLTLLQYILSFDKIVYDILNTLCYVLSVYLICRLCKNTSILSLLTVALTYWLVLPYYSWAAGSLTYMWSSCIVLLFINILFNSTGACRYLALPLALLAGDSHEILSSGLLVILLVLFLQEKTYRKDPIYISSLFFLFIGFLCITLCPGVAKRLAICQIEQPDLSLPEKIWSIAENDIYDFLKMFICNITIYLPIVLALVSISLYLIIRKEKNSLFTALCAGSVAAAAIPFAAQAIYRASLHGIFFYAFLAIGVVLLPKLPLLRQRVIIPILLLFLVQHTHAIISNYRLNIAEKEFEDYVVSRVKSGTHTVLIPEKLRNSRGSGGFKNFNSILENRPAQGYYGIHEFAVLKEEEEIRFFTDDKNFEGCEPGVIRHVNSTSYVLMLQETPQSVTCIFTPDDTYRICSRKGSYLSKISHKKRQSIQPAIVERQGNIYIIRHDLNAGTDELRITYPDGATERYNITATNK